MGLECRLSEFLGMHPEIRKVRGKYRVKRSNTTITLPTSFTKDLCRIIGIIHGDGNMSGKRFLVTDKNFRYHLYLRKLFKKTFGITLNLFEDRKRGTYYSHSKNYIVYKYMTEVLELPSGSVRKSLAVPEFLNGLPWTLQGEYVAGLFDSESHIRKRQAEIEFSTTTEEIWTFIKSFLSKRKIKFSARIRKRRKNPEFEIFIYGRENLRLFDDCVKLKHPEKVKRLIAFLRH